MNIVILTVGSLKEKWEKAAFDEYTKRISGYSAVNSVEIQETRLSDHPSEKEIANALDAEGRAILSRIPKNAAVIALCIEGKKLSSEKFAKCISDHCLNGKSTICFIIGSSFGLSDNVKNSADLKLSMSDMTFPHRLARIMAAEQIYCALSILNNSRYHK